MRLENEVYYLAESQRFAGQALQMIQRALPDIGGDLSEIRVELDRIWRRLDGGGDQWKFPGGGKP